MLDLAYYLTEEFERVVPVELATDSDEDAPPLVEFFVDDDGLMLVVNSRSVSQVHVADPGFGFTQGQENTREDLRVVLAGAHRDFHRGHCCR